MQVSRTTRKVGPGAPQRPCASLGFDERNRLGFGHGFAAVLAGRSRQRRRELEPDNLAANDGCRIHDIRVRERSPSHKPFGLALRLGHAAFVRTKRRLHHVRFWPRDGSGSDTQPPSHLALN
jgi:hypothetical protein